jgi:hypothetical protein
MILISRLPIPSSRLSVLEQRLAGGQGQSPDDIDARFAEAERKRVVMSKERHVTKIEEAWAQREADKMPNENLEPAEPAEQPPDDDDRNKYGAGRFDPSCGNQSQKTPKHPVGDAMVPVPSKAAYEMLMESRKAKQFFDRETRNQARLDREDRGFEQSPLELVCALLLPAAAQFLGVRS